MFKSTARGEAQREWDALRLLAAELPGRAPVPLRFDDADADHPVVVMTTVAGEPLAGAPSTAALAGLVDLYAALHRLPAPTGPEVIGAPSGTIARIVRRRALATDDDIHGDADVAAAWDAAGRWLDRPDTADLGAIRSPCFGRGDTNLANHLWDGDIVRLVDLEDSGRTDTAFQLAELAEHVSNHELPESLWDDLAAALDLDASVVARWEQARRALAIFWFGHLVTSARARELNPPGRAAVQARRVLALLG